MEPNLDPVKDGRHSNDIQLLQSNEWDHRDQRKPFVPLDSCTEINDTTTFQLFESSGGGGEKSDRSCILDNNSYHFWRAYWLSACQVLACKPGLDVNQIIQVSQCSCSGFVKWTTNNRKFCIWLLCWQNAGWPQFKDFCFQLFLQNKALWLTFLVISQINLMHFSPSRHHGTIGSVLISEEDGGGLQSLNGCEN